MPMVGALFMPATGHEARESGMRIVVLAFSPQILQNNNNADLPGQTRPPNAAFLVEDDLRQGRSYDQEFGFP